MGKDRLDRSHEHERNSTHEHRLAATKAHWAYHVNFDSTVFSPLWVLFHHLVGTGKRRESGGTLPPVSWISFVCRIDTNLHLGIFIIINQSVPGLASSSCRQASLSSASYHVITTFTNLRIDLLFVYRRLYEQGTETEIWLFGWQRSSFDILPSFSIVRLLLHIRLNQKSLDRKSVV